MLRNRSRLLPEESSQLAHRQFLVTQRQHDPYTRRIRKHGEHLGCGIDILAVEFERFFIICIHAQIVAYAAIMMQQRTCIYDSNTVELLPNGDISNMI